MCQGALQRLKAAVKTSGDHKQRIILNISLSGIIIKDDKSGDVLHHHPIHKISFISQDTGDGRAFGYVFGCPQAGHEFFAFKTEKTASQVVLTLRDLFLAALELKKKEMEEEAAEVSSESVASNEQKTEDNFHQRTERPLRVELPLSEQPPNASSTAATDNSHLKFSVDSLQQGISHMDRSIAQKFGFSFSEDDVSESSVNSFPSSFQFKVDKLASLYHETLSLSSRSSSTSDYACASSIPEEERAVTSVTSSDPPPSPPRREDRYAVFLEDIDALPSVFDNPDIVTLQPILAQPKTPPESAQEPPKEEEDASMNAPPQDPNPVPFAELDPLGNQPYIDRKDFFCELKKPPKRALKDLTERDPFSTELNGSPNSSFSAPSFNPFGDPPALPPKKPTEHGKELHMNTEDEVPWGHRSPFNPFVTSSEDDPDIPPPSSPPPPPPPPRLPPLATTPAPPPRPPGRAWLSFETPTEEKGKTLEAFNSSTHSSSSCGARSIDLAYDRLEEELPPPLPSPLRRRCSQSDSSPPGSPAWGASARRNAPEVFFPEEIVGDHSPLPEKKPENGGAVNNLVKRNGDAKENGGGFWDAFGNSFTNKGGFSEGNGGVFSNRGFEDEGFTDKGNFVDDYQVFGSSNGGVTSECTSKRFVFEKSKVSGFSNGYTPGSGDKVDVFAGGIFVKLPPPCEGTSPPLPPKPTSSSVFSSSGGTHSLSTGTTYSSSSRDKTTSSSSGGTHSSNTRQTTSSSSGGANSTSSLAFSSSDESRRVGSVGESLVSSGEHVGEEIISSPDSIFRKRDDPFADDFFLSLPRKDKECKPSS
ncbi:hypothetical protein JTE90_005927 [Oedothorax gibbosus]|uniref:PID domain-containing protein n=1 Tax=Oedothorax gibbosus TaxID=931172 RepID=A0AAV6UC33_9ARAC|nr:hypothetical protein JTE90_005927 [Oedothorax gibbosus]